MFLQWVAKCELVPVAADSYVLKVARLSPQQKARRSPSRSCST